MNYEQEFKIFSSNINQAARAFYYHQEFQRQIYDDGIKHQNMPNGYFQDSKLFQAVQDNAQFWMDYKDCTIVFTVIVLGRIFDKDKKYQKSHHIERLIESANNSGFFTNEKLRERKIKGSDNSHEWIDNYMKNTHELSQDDFKNIYDYAKKTRENWESVKDLRNKIYAHQDVIDDLKKNAIFEKSQYLVFEEIIQRLLTLENVFLEAFSNGRAPDFDFKNQHIKNAALKDVKSLLEKISNDK